MNKLAKERSAYLKHAANQKVNWYPWSDEAFKKAESEDKPLFLSSGAVWCHWCHVMAKECFFDDDIAKLLNQNYVCIKLDRDERPYIDRRYQMAVSAMGSNGGWPLSVFLTSDKKPFYGGTYFPPEDRHGRPGLKKILIAVNDLYRNKRDEISEYSEKLINAIKSESLTSGALSENQIDSVITKILAEFDELNGGFGTAPKFPMPGALDLLINRYFLTGDSSIEHCVTKTLKSMASGGIYDHAGDGFHRYSTDEEWTIPHFEKMAEDNAWLLRNYLNAYAVFNDESYKSVAEGIIRFTMNVLSDPDGGFYSSQDADLTPDDEGGYFTWTDDDFRKVLNDEEYSILSLHFMSDAGSMHHDREKKVLFIAKSADELAEESGKNVEDINAIIYSGKQKLLKKRSTRETPFIDKAIYTSINGMFISVFFSASRILKNRALHDFAIKSLERIMEISLINNKLYHTVGVEGLLDDYVYLIDALVAAYEATGSEGYLRKADELMDKCISMFWDMNEGGFFDSDDHMLEIKIKGIQDIPHPSSNSLTSVLLLKLYMITGNKAYHDYAEKTLQTFSTVAMGMGIHAGFYYSALDAYFNSVKLNIDAKTESEFTQSAKSLYVPHLNIVYGEDSGNATVCFRETCYEPISDIESLRKFLQNKKYIGNV